MVAGSFLYAKVVFFISRRSIAGYQRQKTGDKSEKLLFFIKRLTGLVADLQKM